MLCQHRYREKPEKDRQYEGHSNYILSCRLEQFKRYVLLNDAPIFTVSSNQAHQSSKGQIQKQKQGQNIDKQQEKHKLFLVAIADTVANPGTEVVHPHNTSIALAAVMGLRWLNSFTKNAETKEFYPHFVHFLVGQVNNVVFDGITH